MIMKFYIGYYVFLLFTLCQAYKNVLTIEADDMRPYILLSSFGYFSDGTLYVSLRNFTLDPNIFETHPLTFGFTLEKVQNNFVDDAHIAKYRENCRRLNEHLPPTMSTALFFHFKAKNESVAVTSHDKVYLTADGHGSYKTEFRINPTSETPGGLYHLLYHNCLNHDFEDYVKTSFVVNIVERNIGSYLSAGDIPLPFIYFAMSAMFLLSGSVWTFAYPMSWHKIHYLMLSLVTLKTLNLLFHGTNYQYISKWGEPMELLAILYYVTKVFTCAIQFTTIILIGSGWTLVRQMLSSTDRIVLFIGLPLQVLANGAEIMIDESEVGDVHRRLLTTLFNLADSLCYLIILFSIVWSIRHLQDAGKAAVYKHFFYMVVGYICFPRMVVYLSQIYVVLSFQYTWMLELLREIATLLFFVHTGYKFRPRVPVGRDGRQQCE